MRTIAFLIRAQNFHWGILVWCEQLWSIWSRAWKSFGKESEKHFKDWRIRQEWTSDQFSNCKASQPVSQIKTMIIYLFINPLNALILLIKTKIIFSNWKCKKRRSKNTSKRKEKASKTSSTWILKSYDFWKTYQLKIKAYCLVLMKNFIKCNFSGRSRWWKSISLSFLFSIFLK